VKPIILKGFIGGIGLGYIIAIFLSETDLLFITVNAYLQGIKHLGTNLPPG
jgi:hypothetical protein